MLWDLFRLVFWLANTIGTAIFVMPLFGYVVDWDYLSNRQAACQAEVLMCQKIVVHQGIDGFKRECHLTCIDPKAVIIKKK